MLINFNYLSLSLPGLGEAGWGCLQVVLESGLHFLFPRPLGTDLSPLWLNRLSRAGVWRCWGAEETKQARFTKPRDSRKQNWISSTLLLSKQTKLMGLPFLLPSNYWAPVQRIWQHQLTHILILLIPSIHINLTSTHMTSLPKPPRQAMWRNGPTSCRNLPSSSFHQLMRGMQMKSLWDYSLSDSGSPRVLED